MADRIVYRFEKSASFETCTYGDRTMVDPLSVMIAISSGLSLVDKFYDLTKKILGQKATSHSVQVRKDGESIVVEEGGHKQEIRASDLKLSEFDQRRHDTLKRKIDLNWVQY